MTSTNATTPASTALIVGASRGLGYAMAAEIVARGWNIIGTVRSEAGTQLHHLAQSYPARVRLEILDIDDPAQIAAVRDRLSSSVIDMLFVNAGTTTRDEHVHVGDVSTAEFVRVMVTNALGPMRVIEALQHLVPAGGLIGAMSSGQGSIANNETGMREVYRASKSALNMFMRSFSVRAQTPPRSILLLAPGWIRTELGGPDAPYGIEESAPLLVDLLISSSRETGLHYVDRSGSNVPW